MTPFWTESIKQYSEAQLVRFGIFYKRLIMSRIKLSSDFDVLHEETLRLCKKLHFYNANTGEGSLVSQPSWIKEGQDKWKVGRGMTTEEGRCQMSTTVLVSVLLLWWDTAAKATFLMGLASSLRVSPLSSRQYALHWELHPQLQTEPLGKPTLSDTIPLTRTHLILWNSERVSIPCD